MPQTWGPTTPGKLFTTATNWWLTLANEQIHLRSGATTIDGSVRELEKLGVERGTFWATITLPLPNGQRLVLDGIPNATANAMAMAVATAVRRVRVGELIQGFNQAVKPVAQWAQQARSACKNQLTAKGWLTQEFKSAFNGAKPQGFADLLAEPVVARHLESLPHCRMP